MLKLFKILFIISSVLFIISCDYCDYEFSEDYFPLAVGNQWKYYEQYTGTVLEKWEITDVKTVDGIEKYVISMSYQGHVYGEYFIYFDNQKLYTTMYMPNNTIENEYILADFSLEEGDTLHTGLDDSLVLVGEKDNNKITFYVYNAFPPYEKHYPFDWIAFELGKGIIELYFGSFHINYKLYDYKLN